MPFESKISNPNEDLYIPEWVNAAYFEEILNIDEPDYEKILQFIPIAALPPGENFTSIIIRIVMKLEMKDGNRKAKSYILKTMLDNDKGGGRIQELNFFPKEEQMYKKYIPEFEALFREIKRDIKFAPKYFPIEGIKDDAFTFVFEDLKEKSFTTFNRLIGYDMMHMQRALQKLAKFHAASAVWVERNGPLPTMFDRGFINTTISPERQKSHIDTKLKTLREAMPKWNMANVDEYMAALPTVEQYWDCFLHSGNIDPNAFNVLNHGDYWSNNIMLNYFPNGEINDVLLCDFQACNWGSPAQDLIFLITISAAMDIRVKEFDHFIEIYYGHLVKYLKALDYKKPMPKLRDLHMYLYKDNVQVYVLMACFSHLKVTLMPNVKDCCLHNIRRNDSVGEEFRMRSFMNPLYVDAMKEILPFYRRRGLLRFHY